MTNALLERMLGVLGWGDPDNGLWFVGLEEADEMNDESDVATLFNRPDVIATKGIYGWDDPPLRPEDEKDRHPRGPQYQLWRWESRIAAALSGTGYDFEVYSRRCLWFRGCGVFHANLLPLGKSEISAWPSHYENLFGLGPADRTKYAAVVREKRFPLMRAFHMAHPPQATVCYGKTYWPEFEELFELRETVRDSDSDKKLRFFSSRRILLAPFFGHAQMSHRLAERIVDKLKTWQVSLP